MYLVCDRKQVVNHLQSRPEDSRLQRKKHRMRGKCRNNKQKQRRERENVETAVGRERRGKQD